VGNYLLAKKFSLNASYLILTFDGRRLKGEAPQYKNMVLHLTCQQLHL